ncbi:hypothetical protein FRB91_010610 [Serendipita sp. 411]|nr:hypothetical protein FRB91_010610 [Serendipita sp. 411]
MFGTSGCRRLINLRPRLSDETCLYAANLSKTLRSNSFHNSASTHESARKQEARLRKKHQQDKRAEKERLAAQNKPHPALGYSPGNEDVWKTSKLFSIILKPQDLARLPNVPKVEVEMTEEKEVELDSTGREVMSLNLTRRGGKTTGRMVPKLVDGRPLVTDFTPPEFFNFGMDKERFDTLFDDLADLRGIGRSLEGQDVAQFPNSSKTLSQTTEEGEVIAKREQGLKYWTSRVLDLKNANAAGIAMENRMRIVSEFSGPDSPFNPGRAEVQVALLTAKIHNLWDHIQQNRRDIHNRRNLMTFIQARAKILRWFRDKQRARYEELLPLIGVERGAVEGEIIMRRDMFRAPAATVAARATR